MYELLNAEDGTTISDFWKSAWDSVSLRKVTEM